MARVPTYDSPQEQARPLAGVRQDSVASPQLFEGPNAMQRFGAGALTAGNELAGVAVAIQQRENADMLFRAETALKNDYIDYEASARSRVGQAAWGLTKDTTDWWDKTAAAHADNLQNPEQKRLFAQTVAKLRGQSVATMADHESDQRRQSLAESANASIVGSINLAAAGANQWRQGPQVRDLVAAPGSEGTDTSKWGKREDGSDKGNGFLGLLRRPGGGVSSEISIGVNLNGKETEIPTMVPTLTRAEVDQLLTLDPEKDAIPKAIQDKAVAFARQRIADGKSPFADANESPDPMRPADPVSAAKNDVVTRVAVLGKLNGWSAEKVAAEEAHQLTNLHTQVIQNLADTDPTKARTYYNTYKGEINGTSYDAIDKVLKVGGIKEKAQQTSDELTAKGLNEVDGLAYIRKNLKGEEQEAAAHEWKTRQQEVVVARERSQATAADQAYKIYADTGRLSAIPADLITKMDGRVWLALKHDAQMKAEEKLPHTDWDKYYSLRQLAFDNPAAFSRRDLRQDFTYLGKGEREGMIDLQAKVNKPDEMKDVATLENQLGNMHDQMGWGSSDREKKGLFDTTAQNTILAEEKLTGKKLNFEQRQKIIDRLVIDGDINGWWLGGGRKLYEVQGTPDEAKFVPNIPKNERAKIVDALKRNGFAADDAMVMQMYKKKMGLK